MSSLTPLSPALSINERRDRSAITLYLVGELELEGAELLRVRLDELRRTYRGRLILDLRGLQFVASAGIAVLIAAEAYARRDGWVLEVRPGPPQVQRVFDICGLGDALPFTDAGHSG